MDNPRNIAIRRILLPRDTNHRGEIFGGAVLAEIDLAGAVEARRHTRHDVATRSVKEVKFDHPVRVGEVVTFWTRLVRLGTTSITVSVEVESSVDGSEALVSVTAAEIVYVAIERQADGTITKVAL
jgi:acyl-CoA thioesterase YciA